MIRIVLCATLSAACGAAPALAQAVPMPDDTRYWLRHSRQQSGDRQRLTRIARAFADAPMPNGWVPNQPWAPTQIWDFDADGLLESYTIGQSSSDRGKHALLMAERQHDGSWITMKIVDTGEFALLRLTIVSPGKYRTNCNNCSEADRRNVVLDRVGLEYKSNPVQRYFAPGPRGLTEVVGVR